MVIQSKLDKQLKEFSQLQEAKYRNLLKKLDSEKFTFDQEGNLIEKRNPLIILKQLKGRDSNIKVELNKENGPRG